MAANPDMEVGINDLVNFAIERELIPLEQAEAINRELVAAYVKGAAHRDDDDTPYGGAAYGFHRFAAPLLDVMQGVFDAVQYTMEQDPLWPDSPCFTLMGRIEMVLFYEAKDAAAEDSQAREILGDFRKRSRDGSTLH
jgi:hypothetical protein